MVEFFALVDLVKKVYRVDNENSKFAAQAGMIRLNRDGKVEFLSNRSGHFKTGRNQFDLFVSSLKQQGVFADDVKFEIYHIGEKDVILDLAETKNLMIVTHANELVLSMHQTPLPVFSQIRDEVALITRTQSYHKKSH